MHIIIRVCSFVITLMLTDLDLFISQRNLDILRYSLFPFVAFSPFNLSHQIPGIIFNKVKLFPYFRQTIINMNIYTGNAKSTE